MARTGAPDELLSTAQAAALLGVDTSYVRRVAARTAAAPFDDAGPVVLAGERSPGAWQFRRDAVEAFATTRRVPAAVVGYDVTISVPKSVSLLWAISDDPDVRDDVVGALDAAVAEAIGYLEANAAWVRTGGVPTQTGGLLGAAYLHATNRNLEPQLHTHVVIANAAVHPSGSLRALDARGVFLHATTAGHLTAAEPRHQLSARLGVAWTPVENAAAEIVGVPDEAIRVFSSRSAEIATVVEEMGWDSPDGRQIAAYQTRAPKTHGVDIDALRHRWDVRAAEVGLTPDHLQRVVLRPDRLGPTPFDSHDVAGLSRALAGPSGVTKHRAVFDRRDVIQTVADLSGDRLGADQVTALADAWLAGAEVVPPEPIDQRNTIRRRDGTLIATRSGEPIYTTQTMLRLELGQGLAGLTFRAGDDFRNASIGAVSAARATDDDLPAPLAAVTDR